MKIKAWMLLSVISVLLAGCGGGGSDGSSESASSETPAPERSLNPGGTIADPAFIDYQGLNEINEDDFDNHFLVRAQAGDVLIIEAELAQALGDTELRRCYEADMSWTGIRFVTSSERSDRGCSRFFYYEFTEATEHVLKIGYQDGNHGYFSASLLKANDPYYVHDEVGVGGNGNLLGQVDFNGENTLHGESLSNHYAIQGRKGETVYLQAYVDPAEEDITYGRCLNNRGYSWYYSYGWSVMSEVRRDHGYRDEPVYNCSDYIEYTLPEDGTYHFNFRSTKNGSGHFRATRTESPL